MSNGCGCYSKFNGIDGVIYKGKEGGGLLYRVLGGRATGKVHEWVTIRRLRGQASATQTRMKRGMVAYHPALE